MRTLAELNLPDGSMWPELVARRKDGRDCVVYIASIDWGPREGEIIGWALVYPTPNLGGCDFHVYVRDTNRRSGIGRALYRDATRDHGVVRTFAPDDNARSFYKAVTQ